MAETFNCPNCGAQLEYSGDQPTMTCSFCSSLVQVPKELVRAARRQTEDAATAQEVNKWTRWILIGVIVLFVVPTCIGFGGTLLGVAASVIGTIVAVFATFLGVH